MALVHAVGAWMVVHGVTTERRIGVPLRAGRVRNKQGLATEPIIWDQNKKFNCTRCCDVT